MPSRRAFLRSVAGLGLSTLLLGCAGRRSVTSQTANDSLSVATPELLSEPITRLAALWNGNSLPTDDEYGGTHADRLGSSGPGFADYFAKRHGFSPTKTANQPPFRVTVGENGGQDAHAALTAETVDIAALRAETFSTVDSDMDVSGFARHDLFRTGKAIVVSDAIYQAGVTSISREELLGIYNGRLNNWRSLGGPDREIHLVGTVNDSHPEIFEQTVLRDQPLGGADELYGQPRRKVAAVSDRDDTVTRIPVRDVETLRAGGTGDYRLLDIEVDGEPRGPGGIGYPGTYPVPLFTNGSPENHERAFLDALSTAAVQPLILNHADARLDVIPAATKPDY